MYLGVDLWDKRVWLAIELNWIVIPKEVVPRVEIISSIKKYIKSYEIKVIVVWLPFDLYNKELKQLTKTEKFIGKLKNIFPDCKIVWYDERFTTMEAKNIVTNISKKNKLHKDDIAAALILEGYLSENDKKI